MCTSLSEKQWRSSAPLAMSLSNSFMHRNFKMPMHQADAMTEASCLQSDA
ncbi:hypothetical protein PSCFBP2116_P300049 (plasmid) [Pseudomonas syringae]|nr:hypothetical protein PSCFBP2116_P300049 [Pseudomonas syringae]